MRKNENGRSMIEMLGVLAIIGVLSVGGIYGYTTAMRKYRANEIVQAASMLASRAHSASGGEGADVTLATDEKPGGLTVAMVACTPSNGVSVVHVGLASGDNPKDESISGDLGVLCRAINAIAPHEAGDTANRAGYYISCSTAATVSCSS